jgi:hypothetical protein
MWALRQSLQGLIVLTVATLTLSACASRAVMQNMVVSTQEMKATSPSLDFKNGMTIAKFDSDETTNPPWTLKVDRASFQGALSASLEQNGLLADQQSLSKFDVFASIVSLKQPMLALDFKVTSSVNYQVVERDTKVTWYEELISASYTPVYSDNGFTLEGLRLANEGAIRENIKEFITQLSKTAPPIINKVGKTLPVQNSLSTIQKLHDLQKLVDDGLIENEEYVLKRDQILNGL